MHEFIPPSHVDHDGHPIGAIRDGDVIVNFNYQLIVLGDYRVIARNVDTGWAYGERCERSAEGI